MASQQEHQEAPGTVICVYCAAFPGVSPAHLQAARDLAHVFHKRQIKLVYGGGNSGMMGEIAKTLISLSGPEAVHGIIPNALVKYEQSNRPADSNVDPAIATLNDQLSQRTTIVPSMHTRKRMMTDEVKAGGPGSGFIALSGGYGTMDELMEAITWNQLGIHDKGIVVYNVEGYFDGLLEWVNGSVEAGFVRPGAANIMVEAREAEEAVQKLKDYQVAEGRLHLDWSDM